MESYECSDVHILIQAEAGACVGQGDCRELLTVCVARSVHDEHHLKAENNLSMILEPLCARIHHLHVFLFNLKTDIYSVLVSRDTIV